MERKLKRIHAAATDILERIGIRLHHPGIMDDLAQNGVRISGNRVFFTPQQVMESLAQAPSQFRLHARNPEHDLDIGGDNVALAPGYGCAAIMEMDGTCRQSLIEDQIKFAKLVHQSEHFKINGGIMAQPGDVAADVSHLLMLYAVMQHSDKCLIGIPGAGEKIEQVMEMASILFGGDTALKEKPRILTPISTLSPLQLDEMALQSMRVCARYRQPMVISPAPAAGTTGPINLAGNLALATAEALAAIAIVQMLGPGTPVIFGINCLGADLTTGNVSIGSPAFALQAKYTAALARFYKLPSRGGGALTDARTVSVQSGYESMFSLLNTFRNRINYVVHSAGILDSYTAMSYEKFIIDLEMIRMVKYYVDDLETGSDADFGLDVIEAVGPGGEFLSTPETFEKCRTHSWYPEIGVRGSFADTPHDVQVLEKINQAREKLLRRYRKPEMDAVTARNLEDYLLRCGVARDAITAAKG
jgi:trimethylamine:corrinoid methyltransferase-like protein